MKAAEGIDMQVLKNWFKSEIQIAHDTLKWALSGVSAFLTFGFVLLLETA
jgi:hypothetical protein